MPAEQGRKSKVGEGWGRESHATRTGAAHLVIRARVTISSPLSASIAPTKRRRFWWAAWWSGPPVREPFRKPDASSGGARTREEARREAERAAGRSLVEIEGRWARAVVEGARRTEALAGAGGGREGRGRDGARAGLARSGAALDVGRPRNRAEASAADIKKAFRKRALETHPDRGGDAEASGA